MSNRRVQMNVTVKKELKEALKLIAENDGRTVSNVIENWIREAIKKDSGK